MTAQPKSGHGQDALSILRRDHETVQTLFDDFEKGRGHAGPGPKRAQVDTICRELAVHAALEEQLFYPAVAATLDDTDALKQALVEHAGVKWMIAQLASMNPEDPLYDATVKVMGEQVRHHVHEEQDLVFPVIPRDRLDLEALGDQLLQLKDRLMAQAGQEGGLDPLLAASGDQAWVEA